MDPGHLRYEQVFDCILRPNPLNHRKHKIELVLVNGAIYPAIGELLQNAFEKIPVPESQGLS